MSELDVKKTISINPELFKVSNDKKIQIFCHLKTKFRLFTIKISILSFEYVDFVKDLGN